MYSKCPTGFVIPTNKYDSRIQWIGYTGCAFSCRLPIWSESQFDKFDNLYTYLSILSLPFIFLLLFTWIINKEKRKQYLVICLAFSAGMNALLSMLAYRIPWSQRSCSSNAVPIDFSDGFSTCVLQGLSYLYFGLTISVCWMNQSIDLYLKVVLGMRSTDKYKVHYITSIFLLPLVPLIYVASTKSIAYAKGDPICWVVSSSIPNLDIYVWYAPIAVMTFVGLCCMTVVLYKIVLSVIKTSTNKTIVSTELISVVRTPVLFVLSFLSFFLSLVAFRAEFYTSEKLINARVIDWVQCVFTHYDGISDESYIPLCGSYVKTNLSVTTAMWAFICVAGQAALVALVYLPNGSVLKIWWEWCLILVGRQSTPRSKRKVYIVGASSVKAISFKDASQTYK